MARVKTPPALFPATQNGPQATPFELLFKPLWPVVVPLETWQAQIKMRAGGPILPDSLLQPLLIWILDCFPEHDLVLRLIEHGRGERLPPRNPMMEPERADPLERAAEMLWARAADVLGRGIPSIILSEIAMSSGLDIRQVDLLIPPLAAIYSQGRLFCQAGQSSAFGCPDPAVMQEALTAIAAAGELAWQFGVMLLLAGRNDIDVALPAARAVARKTPKPHRYAEICEQALAAIFPAMEARCEALLRDIEAVRVVGRADRRSLIWLNVPELATILALIRFATRCSLHELPTARLRLAVSRTARAQFILLAEEEMKLSWPDGRWSDPLMIAFERGNRRLRDLASLGISLSEAAAYRPLMQRIAERYRDDRSIGLNTVERLHAVEILLDLPGKIPALAECLAHLPEDGSDMLEWSTGGPVFAQFHQ